MFQSKIIWYALLFNCIPIMMHTANASSTQTRCIPKFRVNRPYDNFCCEVNDELDEELANRAQQENTFYPPTYNGPKQPIYSQASSQPTINSKLPSTPGYRETFYTVSTPEAPAVIAYNQRCNLPNNPSTNKTTASSKEPSLRRQIDPNTVIITRHSYHY